MMKPISEITFKEFSAWCNDRECDGQWSMCMSALCVSICTEIYGIRKLFGTKKARENRWNELKAEHFKLDAQLDIPTKR